MSFEDLKNSVGELVRQNMQWAEPLVFVMGFAEGIPGLSLLIPSTGLFLVIGGIHGAAGGSFVPIWLAASIGAVLGDVVVYLIARRYKEEVVRLPLFDRYPGFLSQGRIIVERWGVLAVVGGKFLTLLRPFVPAVAGMLGMPLWQFIPASVASSLAWAAIFLGPGYGLTWLFF